MFKALGLLNKNKLFMFSTQSRQLFCKVLHYNDHIRDTRTVYLSISS